MKTSSFIALQIILLFFFPVFASAQIFTSWYFNGNTSPSLGSGSITGIGGVSTGFSNSINALGGSAFSNTNFPAQGNNSGTAGIEISASTEGKTGISLTWIQRHSGSSSRYMKILISTDGNTFTPLDLTNENSSANLLTPGSANASNVVVDQDVFETIGEDTWHRRTINLSAIDAVNNNPNFKCRMVSVFAPFTSNYTASGNGRTYATTGTYRYDSIEISSSSNIVTPLNFIDFKGKISAGGIVLNWQTALEKNVEKFTVLHALNNQNFQILSHQPASNTNMGKYSFIHHNAPIGTNFYRILATDVDGRSQLSPIIQVKSTPQQEKENYFFPTVVSNQINTVIYSEKNTEGQIRIINQAGTNVYTQKVLLKTGINYHSYSLQHLESGIYFVQFPPSKGFKTQSFIKM
jgi:hypothetical protein